MCQTTCHLLSVHTDITGVYRNTAQRPHSTGILLKFQNRSHSSAVTDQIRHLAPFTWVPTEEPNAWLKRLSMHRCKGPVKPHKNEKHCRKCSGDKAISSCCLCGSDDLASVISVPRSYMYCTTKRKPHYSAP